MEDDGADELMEQVNTLKLIVKDLEKERDFCFAKLRNIGFICQENEGETALLCRGLWTFCMLWMKAL